MNICEKRQKQGDGRAIPALLPAAIILTAAFLLALQPELRLAVPMLVGATAAMAMALAATLYYGEREKISWSPAVILAVALVLRLLFLFAPPQLSDDSYRYLWDGSRVLHGINPYAAAPAAVRPPPELAAVHARINHPGYVTIYPPMAQVIFAGGAALGGAITGLKALLVLLDLGLCLLVALLLKRLEQPVWRAALYAWNPLPLLEIAGSGHVDGAGLTMLIGSFCLLAADRRNAPASGGRPWPFLLSGALLAAAGLVKLFPFILAPLLFLMVPPGRRRYFAAGFLGGLAALLLPFLPHLANMAATLDAYARNWEFAGFAFHILRTATGSGTAARMLLSSSFLLVAATITLRCIGSIGCGIPTAAGMRRALGASYAIAMAFLLFTPTLQPWYALCLAVFLPFCAGPAGLVLCWAVFLAYRVQLPYFIQGQWLESMPVTAAIFLAPVTAYLAGRLFGGKRRAAAC
ncbi:hypothetical protein F6V30_09685 [Oryzomonas sagensis]|uniref:DUF2029 domain-containing protein n=1 Tax=Oryzomonas sagensis TaxID=2603857 RepID=A0ABQ6TP43_9BACT|nr:hypothetical protein [Oryzomonas sagensis]KAB0670411.1 hypothetical protein F6V30_09685 [Oryzomonas sagensis]